MSSKITPCQPAGVQACKIIEQKLRERDGRSAWSEYRIAKAIGISQTAYRTLRDSTEHPTTRTAKKLQKFAERELGMSLAEFWKLV